MTRNIGHRIQEASRSVSAPLALRESLDRRPARRPGPSRLSLAAIGLTLAIIATMATLIIPSGPTVTEVADAALRAPQRAAPAGSGAYLHGFTAIGARTDTVGGRTAKTVIYKRGATGVHYTIVDGRELTLPAGKRVQAGDISLAPKRDGDVSLVAWHTDGKTCVLASKALSTDELAALLRQ